MASISVAVSTCSSSSRSELSEGPAKRFVESADVLAQQVKPYPMLECSFNPRYSVFDSAHADAFGKQQRITQVLGHLPLIWETLMEVLAPSFGFAQS